MNHHVFIWSCTVIYTIILSAQLLADGLVMECKAVDGEVWRPSRDTGESSYEVDVRRLRQRVHDMEDTEEYDSFESNSIEVRDNRVEGQRAIYDLIIGVLDTLRQSSERTLRRLKRKREEKVLNRLRK